MKSLLTSLLAYSLLFCLPAYAQETHPAITELFSVIEKSKIVNKAEFKEHLLNTAAEAQICPRLLFSLGIDQWESLTQGEANKQLKLLAHSAKFLK